MQPNKVVSVIIPSKRSKALKRCLSSLETQTYRPHMFETIVITPERHVEENAPRFNIRIIVNEKANQAEARNIAEKFAKGDILAFCDDDCVLPPNWIENAVTHFSDSKVATVGGPSVPPFTEVSLFELLSGLLMVSFLGTGSHRKAYMASATTKVSNCNPVNIICANMFVDRAKFNEVGGFDPIVPQEEDRLNTKFTMKGYALVYDPKCSNTHYQRPWGIRSICNIFWLMSGQGSLTVDRWAPSTKLYLIPPIFTVGLVASPIFLSLPIFSVIYIILVVGYLGCIFAETTRLLIKFKFKTRQSVVLFLTFPFALFIHHFVSGLGFIFGFCRRLLNKLRSKL